MSYNVLATLVGKYREVGLGEAALYALLGFAIVFAGISFLILVVWLVGKVMDKINGKTTKKEAPKVEDSPIQEEAAEALSEEVVAVITAALMAYYQQNNPKCEFTVKRIKRI